MLISTINQSRSGNEQESGTVLGTAALSEGTLRDAASARPACQYEFEVSDLRRADFYEMENNGRPGPVWSHSELDAAGWEVFLK